MRLWVLGISSSLKGGHADMTAPAGRTHRSERREQPGGLAGERRHLITAQRDALACDAQEALTVVGVILHVDGDLRILCDSHQSARSDESNAARRSSGISRAAITR